MTSLATVQMLAQQKPRVWRKATIDQRRQIVARYEETGSINKAFETVKAHKVMLSDLSFDTSGGMFIGGRR